jgi:hypothetical protein
MQKFQLNRLTDATGISGTGIVAEGYRLDNGICVMKWLTNVSSVAVYQNLKHIEIIHGHAGMTHIEIIPGEIAENLVPLWAFDPIEWFEDIVEADS